jgi:CelD/BcsL family acetyltransferase involved in cellulose biosynthesis
MHHRFELFAGADGLERLSPAWRRLCERLPDLHFAQLWEWHRAFVDHLAPSPGEALFVAVYEGDEVSAIVPLVRRTRFAGLGCTTLELPRHEHMAQADLIVDPASTRRLKLTSLLEALEARLGSFDMLRLGPVLEDSMATRLIEATDHLCGTEPAGHSDALLARPYPALMSEVSANLRSSLNRARKRLARAGGARVVAASAPDELARAFPVFLAIEASGWKGAAGTGTAIALDARLRAFYDQLIARLGASGRCQIHTLFAGDTAIASQVGVVVGQRYYQLKIGYDERYAHLAPGNMLLEAVLQEYAGHATVRYVDLVSGADWHHSWRPIARKVLQHFVFRPSLRGRLAWAALAARQASRPARRLLAGELARGWGQLGLVRGERAG